MTTAIIVKYVAWALANGLALAGAWFVNFTENGVDHRKKLTRWGKLAIPLALVSFALALGLTIKGDLTEAEASRKRTAQEEARDLKFSEMIDLLKRKQDTEFADTNKSLSAMNLTPEVSREIDALYERRKALKEEWEEYYRQYAELNRNENYHLTSFQRQQLLSKMSETGQQIESILDRLAAYEKRPREEYRRNLPPTPPGGLKLKQDPE